jgi:anti-sigma B factor antagonist
MGEADGLAERPRVDPGGADGYLRRGPAMLGTTAMGSWVVVQPPRDLDAEHAPPIRRLLADLAQDGCTQVLLDLGNVCFVDSTGLGVLVGAARRLYELGGELRVARPYRGVSAILKLSGVCGALLVYDTIQAAERELVPD